MRSTLVAAAGAALITIALARPARADEAPPEPVVEEPCPLNALDCIAVRQFSATAAATSDALFLTGLALPVAMELGRGLGDDSLERGAAYAGAVGATAVTALIVKITVRRPRPYTYRRDPKIQAYARSASDRHHSFFSGHTSLTFAAATSGGILHNAVATDDESRLAVWAAGGAIAASTGIFRIRAGRHYPTDVLVGAVVGTAAGIGITMAVAPDATLRWQDGAALAGGVALGAAVASLVPMPSDVVVPLGGSGGVVVEGPIGVLPAVLPGGGVGLSVSAQMR